MSRTQAQFPDASVADPEITLAGFREFHCLAESCPLNNQLRCRMVCGIKITENGECAMLKRLIRQGVVNTEHAVCRACGLPIVRHSSNLQWYHEGVRLPHPAEPAGNGEGTSNAER